jgi:hypothetical protein
MNKINKYNKMNYNKNNKIMRILNLMSIMSSYKPFNFKIMNLQIKNKFNFNMKIHYKLIIKIII